MDYTVIGFPRIGENRELKKLTESYFKKEIDKDYYLDEVKKLKIKQFNIEKDNLKEVPVLDYSLYDLMLDTIFLLGVYPKRYKDLNLNRLDTYFSLARGYQGENGDCKALTMKKWFNTNYHYMVPELYDDSKFNLEFDYVKEEIELYKSLGGKIRPVVIGPFTFLKLSKYKGSKTICDYVSDITNTYKNFLNEISKIHSGWIQIDEPFLVKDLEEEDIKIFNTIYKELLKSKNNKILLQTYFGDLRDCYTDAISLDFDGIGLDFIEGKKSLELLKEYGTNNKILYAGIVNGKNIWKSNYKEKHELINEIKKYSNDVILSTSSSLLHVPYTIKNETKLSKDILKYFAFAYEKLDELKDLANLDINSQKYLDNVKLIEERSLNSDIDVKNRISNLKESDFKREVPRLERQKLQKTILNLGLFPTTTIGSFPQTLEVKSNRGLYKKGIITKEKYEENIKKYIKNTIKLQEEIGLDVLVHGEFERNDMVEYFGENLDGFIFTSNGWVQSYGTRGVKPPVVFGDIKRSKPFTVDYIKYANSLTEKEVKGMLTGPVTILNWSFPREDISIKECMYQIALALHDEVLDLEKAGIKIIQIDEAALREKLPLRKADWYTEYLDFAIKAFRLTNSKVKPETQIHTHMCYSEFEDIVKAIDDMDADVITFEASRSELSILDFLKNNNFETEVGPGVYDIHSPRIPTIDEIKNAISIFIKKIPLEKIWINPDCGLKTRGNYETKESLIHMVQAAKEMRELLNK